MQNSSSVKSPPDFEYLKNAPEFNLETILDLTGAPASFKKDFAHQDSKRFDLRSRCEALANIPREQNLRLPYATPGMESAWKGVFNTAPTVYEPGLRCDDPKRIAKILRDLRITNDLDFRTVIDVFTTHADSGPDFAMSMAHLVVEVLDKHDNRAMAEEVRESVCATEIAKINQAWVRAFHQLCLALKTQY
ncbi:hypothetical protein PENSPDRAFT_46035 [Peniophora sp. CONT]|nr:hypothetical protein PENSPDRAFT_46035 [Peniophora sp. CONT]